MAEPARPVHAPAPVLLTRERVTVLVACILVALGSGTNYVYSAYAPQLGSQLHINHTKLNVIGLAGNLGVYATAPVWGRIADRRGPKGLLVIGLVFLLVGYLGIRAVYDAGLPEGETLPTWRLGVLIACSFMSGIGGNGGLAAALNTAAKSFPDRSRATANGLVLSGFGLSAFFFSSLAHTFFHDDTSAFLLLLALGTAAPMVLGLALVRRVPPSAALERAHSHARTRSSPVRPSARRDDSNTRLLALEDGAPGKTPAGELADVPGRELWRHLDFWILFGIIGLLAGTGIMYINNVGAVTQALALAGRTVLGPKEAAQAQATQVSTVSVGNCLGRIVIGVVADFVHNTLQARRAYCLALVSTLFLFSQLSLLAESDVAVLWRTSALLGTAYGALFGLCPTISGEWFGLAHFSENWGFLSLAPLFGGNAFSLAFGADVDAHAAPTPAPGLTIRGGAASDAVCTLGAACYARSVRLTAGAAALALALSVWAGVRDRRKAAAVEAEVLWDEEDDE